MDNASTKAALQSALQDQTLRIIDSYLQVWAGFVYLGREVGGPSPVVSEVADWWLVYSLSDFEVSRTADDWTARGNPLPFSRTIQGWLSSLVFHSLKRNKVLTLTRLEAAERLVRRWNPFPFNPRAKKAWTFVPRNEREDLRERLNDWVIEACEELAKKPRRWRFDRRYLKDATGQVVKCKFDDLPLPKSVKALRNAVIKRFEAAILEIFASRRLRDFDGAIISSELECSGFGGRDQSGAFIQDEAVSVLDNAMPGDESADVVLDDSLALADSLHDEERRELKLLEQCPIFTRRQRELISHLRLQHPQGQHFNVSAAAREMGIKPQTGWVHWHNIKKKRIRARIWLRTRQP